MDCDSLSKILNAKRKEKKSNFWNQVFIPICVSYNVSMLFKEFAEYLEKLEKISSRLAITDVLAELIEKMNTAEINKGIYLVLGQLGPDFANKEFGMAVKMVIRAISQGAGISTEEVMNDYKKIGDLGVLLEKLPFQNEKRENHSLIEVYDYLLLIAEDGGLGSQDRKVNKLSEILLEVSALERKYISRMVVGRLRLGFSAKTVFDALSQIENGNKTLRKELDSVFQIYPDPGLITKMFKEKGMTGLRDIKVEVGVPVVPALCQRLNEYGEIVDKMKDVAVERKYDGTRLQIHFNRLKNEIKTYTRNLEENSWMFPELMEMGKWIEADEVIMDCEAAGYERKTGKVLPFQMTMTRKRKHNIADAAELVPMRFFLFDILSKNGESLIDKPYFERREILENVVKSNETIVVDEFVRTSNPDEVKKLHEKYLSEGFEGAVLKVWDGRYLPGRQGWNWVKIKEVEGTSGKLSDTLDLVILGYYYGRGKRVGFGIGAFLVGLKKGESWVSLAKIGTGLTDDEFRSLRKKLDGIELKEKPKNYLVEGTLLADVWVEPRVVVEVAADEITISNVHAGGIALRFPRLVRFREDKRADQSTTWKEVEEIAKISNCSS
ncbi:MAG TPA: ATP-dependent DNA ligase [Spirochaetia bacterium]|nr:ATP-dependent DNA ligase [Spirochaetia bacterium]